MYNHRIVPENAPTCVCDCFPHAETCFHKSDTIPITSEWTAEEAVEILKWGIKEWDEVWQGFGEWYQSKWATAGAQTPKQYIAWKLTVKPFCYIREVISLAPLKGLAVEEIKKLSEARK